MNRLFMQQANMLIVGAGISGLPSAAFLQKEGIEYIIIGKTLAGC